MEQGGCNHNCSLFRCALQPRSENKRPTPKALDRMHEMKPLVSILIPAYNAERWIAETMRSALRQTWPNKEILVVDDGSTDQTLRIARQFPSKAISVVSQKNQGAAAARDRAFDLCQVDY